MGQVLRWKLDRRLARREPFVPIYRLRRAERVLDRCAMPYAGTATRAVAEVLRQVEAYAALEERVAAHNELALARGPTTVH